MNTVETPAAGVHVLSRGPLPSPMSFRYGELESAIVDSVRTAVEGRDVAVAFSGGLDSGLVSAIAREYAESVTLYTCGTANAFDVVMARDLSARLGLPWNHVQISKSNTEARIAELITATGVSDPFTISYELQLFCVCREAGEDVVVTGQGADEFFMGCAKYVGASDGDYEVLRNAGVERLLDVSVPCERAIAAHFRKELVYPYLDREVLDRVSEVPPEELRPTDMDSRKAVLKEVAVHLGHPYLAERKKKSSQYGSGTTDIIRALAKERGMMYNEYISSVYDGALQGMPSRERGAVVNARIDPIVKLEAEGMLQRAGVSPSEAIEAMYRRIVSDGGPGFLGL